nr:hypothetical protein [Tanacetum cinerariifolium]
GSNSHNVAFASSENTSSINETVNAAHDIIADGSKEQPSASGYADDVSMITMRVKKFMKRTWRNLNFNGNEPGNSSADNERRVILVETPASALVVQDGLDLKNQLEKPMKEKDDLKEKLTKFEESSKNLTKLINSQMSANDKTGLGYDSQLSENEMSKCEIFETTSDSSVSEIDEDNNQAKDRYKVGIGYHVYMLPRADLSFAGLDDFVFKFKISETKTSVNEIESIASKSSEEIKEEPKTVRSSAHVIED